MLCKICIQDRFTICCHAQKTLNIRDYDNVRSKAKYSSIVNKDRQPTFTFIWKMHPFIVPGFTGSSGTSEKQHDADKNIHLFVISKYLQRAILKPRTCL